MSQRPLGDMDPEDFRREGHRIVDWLADYLAAPEQYPVLSRSKPGDLVRALPAAAPEDGEPFDAIFEDFEQHVVPGLTHWNHPGFFAYFAISGSGPGVLAEMLSAGLNVQAMLWRTSPAATELEEVALRWLRAADAAAVDVRGRHLRHRLDRDAARAGSGARGGRARRARSRDARAPGPARACASTAQNTRTRPPTSP